VRAESGLPVTPPDLSKFACQSWICAGRSLQHRRAEVRDDLPISELAITL
jgi:hypothetical protein